MRRIISLIAVLIISISTIAVNTAYGKEMLVYGERNNDVLQLQKRLEELGFFTNNCTGYFGDLTKTAVSNFQTANGLKSTGVVDEETLKKLKADDAVTKQQYIESSNTGETLNVTLKRGDSGRYVKKLQTRLKELGFFKVDATGNYGEVTEYSVKYFQLVNNLPITGIADPTTLAKLTAKSAVPIGNSEETLLLKYGSSGKDVRALQNYLKDLGYFTGECSAKFGKLTKEAVSELQRCNNLEVTGECNVEMRLTLISGGYVSKEEADIAQKLKRLKKGDTDEGVKLVKQQLFELGYYSGSMDDEFTDLLSESIQKFQTVNGLKITKEADRATRQLLNEGKAISWTEYTVKMSNVEVKSGNKGYAVELLQIRLKELGFYKGEINASFDKATEKAVRLFQRGHSLKETGKADKETRAIMNSEDAYTYEVAEQLYYERLRLTKREETVQLLIEQAKKTLGKRYEAGKIGDKTYGNAGLLYTLYKKIGIEITPTVNMQYEAAVLMESYSEIAEDMQISAQVFVKVDGDLLTGIYIGEDTLLLASPDEGKVIGEKNFLEMEKYEFVGFVLYF